MPADRVLLDALFLQFFVAPDESNDTIEAIRRVLRRKPFRLAIARAVRRVLRRQPTLAALTITLTR